MKRRSIFMAVSTATVVVFLLSAMAQPAAAAIVEHTFVVSQMNITRLCKETLVTVVNGQLPGPALEVTEGDSVVVHVVNQSPFNITIHWHGVRQYLNCWADGVPLITQRPIRPNNNYTYRFNVAGQEGTLWWHAHVSYLRATLHGAIVIRPRHGDSSYPFPKPHREIPIIIGEWWEMDLAKAWTDIKYTLADDQPNGVTINGKLGDLYNCSGAMEEGYMLDVEPGKTYLLRVINTALFSEYYIKIARHNFTVVAADANYVSPYTTSHLSIAPGETLDALVVADANPGKYYIVASPYQSPEPEPQHIPFVARGIVRYKNKPNHSKCAAGSRSEGEGGHPSSCDVPIMPEMPDNHDSMTSFYFHSNLTMLRHSQQHKPVPARVDERLFITLGLGTICRQGKSSCRRGDVDKTITVATMNNISFQMPAVTTPLLNAHYYHTKIMDMLVELPDRPLWTFNFTDCAFIPSGPGTKEAQIEPTSRAPLVRWFKHGTVVEMVFQGIAVLQSDSNPMHLHGHDMYVLAQGLGNYNETRDVKSYNLVDPPMRNTITVPSLGWVAIRFIADNPGLWFMHCHFEFHLTMGMAAVFIVEDGPTVDTSLPPPPTGLDDNLMLDEYNHKAIQRGALHTNESSISK